MAQEADLQGEALSGMYPEEIREQFTAAGWEPFRAQQVSGWISKGVLDAADMRNLPQNIREALAAKKPRPVCTSSVGKMHLCLYCRVSSGVNNFTSDHFFDL